ncbi:hypothetical protein HBI81_242140 [Parastagonospora nodorum]|nr:hypothetical protein HBI74_214400 [Parastagonospora nodorum]KAH5758952.1 hypothetical protein HBI16_198150 [Parastagonospora nodorum]KAH6106789.1 hypothetical protein HBI64_234610 [Parastagonospora nodorum]KAH6511666.1 hypothetical protein HBI81_242140 [Parastagonospora nodorum]
MASSTNAIKAPHFTLDDLQPSKKSDHDPSAAWLGAYISEPHLYFSILKGKSPRLDEDGTTAKPISVHVAYKASVLKPMQATLANRSADERFFTLPWNFTATGEWKDVAHLTHEELWKHKQMELPRGYIAPKDVDMSLRLRSPPPPPEINEKRERSLSIDTPDKKRKIENLERTTKDLEQKNEEHVAKLRAIYWTECQTRLAERAAANQFRSETKTKLFKLQQEKDQANSTMSAGLETANRQLDEAKKAREGLEAEKEGLREELSNARTAHERDTTELRDSEDRQRKRTLEACSAAVKVGTRFALTTLVEEPGNPTDLEKQKAEQEFLVLFTCAMSQDTRKAYLESRDVDV